MATISCPYITSATISLSSGSIIAYSVTWQYAPLGIQTVLFQYRKQGDVTWINASTNEKVNINGTLVDGSLIIVSSPDNITNYEIRIVNQCGSLEYIQTVYSGAGFYSNIFFIESTLYNICGAPETTLYSKFPMDTGVVMYEDAGLSTPLTGYSFIVNSSGGEIFEMNSGTGVVGASTTYKCNGNFIFQGQFGNSVPVCANVLTTLYSDEFLRISSIIYTDKSLSEALTGYDYIAVNNVTYNLNNATGEIVSVNGATCPNTDYYQYSLTIDGISLVTPVQLFSAQPFDKGAKMYTDYPLTTLLTGFNYIKKQSSPVIRDINATTGVVGCIATPC